MLTLLLSSQESCPGLMSLLFLIHDSMTEQRMRGRKLFWILVFPLPEVLMACLIGLLFLCKGTLILVVVSLCPQKHAWKYIEQMYYTRYHLYSTSDSLGLISISTIALSMSFNKDFGQLPPDGD